MVFVQCLERISLYTIASGSVVYKFGAFITNWEFPGTSRNAISPPYFEIQKIRRKSLGGNVVRVWYFSSSVFSFCRKGNKWQKKFGF